MESLYHISFPTVISNNAFALALADICCSRFGSFVQVISAKASFDEFDKDKQNIGWIIRPAPPLLCGAAPWPYQLQIFRENSFIFGVEYAETDWVSWLSVAILNDLSYQYNGRIFCESDAPNAWKGEPNKRELASFEAWLYEMWHRQYGLDQITTGKLVEDSMKKIPEGLRTL